MRANDVIQWLRGGGIAFAVLALAASAVEVRREGKELVAPPPVRAARDPLEIELGRCNSVVPASGRDDACERAWAENRRRFLGASHLSASASAAAAGQPSITGDRP